MPVIAFQFSAQDIDIHLPLLYILLPASIPYIINVVYVEVLASYKYFIFPQIITVINNIFIILFIVLFHASLGVFHWRSVLYCNYNKLFMADHFYKTQSIMELFMLFIYTSER